MDTENLEGFPIINDFKIEGVEFQVNRFDKHESDTVIIGYFVMAFNRDTKKATTFRVSRNVSDKLFSVESGYVTAPEKLTLDAADPSKLLTDALKALGFINDDGKLTEAFQNALDTGK